MVYCLKEVRTGLTDLVERLVKHCDDISGFGADTCTSDAKSAVVTTVAKKSLILDSLQRPDDSTG